jgi:hypothetical protein
MSHYNRNEQLAIQGREGLERERERKKKEIQSC